jgi:carbonic anhydrase
MTDSQELIRQARIVTPGEAPRTPRKKTAVIACIDARIYPTRLLGGSPGDFHIIRNAGGLVTDDVIRSLMISQFNGTKKIIVIMHTDCGAMAYPAEEEGARLEEETGHSIGLDLHPFDDLEHELRRGVATLRETPLLSHRDRITGIIYDVETGKTRTVVE